MSRSHRLFDLMQVLRRHRGTVSGEVLARETGVSLRTLRRDIATLQSIGAHIEGEAGVGYILRPDFLLPPLSFTEEEVQALVVGAQWVSRHADEALALAVQNALAKINGVLPAEMRAELDDNALYIFRKRKETSISDLAQVRRAMREQRKMHIGYADDSGAVSQLTLWPIMLGFVESQRLIAAWCEESGDFRRIRTDRIVTVDFLEERYPRARRQLVKEWRAGLPCNQSDST
ncbi:helix-turn-helix transcriptional regulator [Variovorax boronicumulans]|uniref:helix-turn-helix transcriptional regulator n=1 Tax=Variovorax boronicumulans TaxID=436515 RepID=UPI002788FCE3|nr:YafY family protein [Variovorax boronicumulans]MDQ0039341.1 putative DNA-binding transcriptional regulator YafY [Variovorax boronicumulans]